jgi:hypothetical protein
MSDFWIYIIIAIIILHFLVGFGYLIYKMSPTKEDKEKMKKDNLKDQN